MTDRSNETRVSGLMKYVLPSEKAEEVARWIMARGLLGQGDQVEEAIREAYTNSTRDELADQLWRSYCERCGEDYVFEPENLRAVCDMVAERLAYEDTAAWQQHDLERCASAMSRLKGMVWRSHYLARQRLRTEEKAKLVGKFLKDWRESDDDFRKFEAARKLAKMESARVEYTDAELFEVIAEKLEANPRRHYSYNQMWRELGLPQRQLMKVKDHLEKLADSKSTVYTSVVRYKPRPIKGKQMPDLVYQWAPARRRLGERPTKGRRLTVTKEVIRAYLKVAPDKTTREIIAHVRESLGSVGNEAVTKALSELVGRSKEVVVTAGAHRSFIHRLAEPKVTDAELGAEMLAAPTSKPVAAPQISRKEHGVVAKMLDWA